MKYKTQGNCPFCDSERGISTPWGMSSQAMADLKERHDAGHPENMDKGSSKEGCCYLGPTTANVHPKLKELRKWLDEDRTICKTDKDYICNFITKNYISREEIEKEVIGEDEQHLDFCGRDDDDMPCNCNCGSDTRNDFIEEK